MTDTSRYRSCAAVSCVLVSLLIWMCDLKGRLNWNNEFSGDFHPQPSRKALLMSMVTAQVSNESDGMQTPKVAEAGRD